MIDILMHLLQCPGSSVRPSLSGIEKALVLLGGHRTEVIQPLEERANDPSTER